MKRTYKSLFSVLMISISFLACKKTETPCNINIEDCREYYSPVGEVIEIPLPDGNLIYMDSDSVYFSGDILYTKEQVAILLSPQTKGAVIKNVVKYWTSRTIPYFIPSSFPSNERALIEQGLEMISNSAYVNFVSVSNTPTSGILFKRDTVNTSYIGRSSSINEIKLAAGAFNKGVVAHEVMHTLGYFHEQSRTDRDSYVTINYQNIESDKIHNFDKYTSRGYTGEDLCTYDYSSIMHYGSYAFSKNDLPTIVKKDGSTFSAQRTYLRATDIQSLNYIYGPIAQIQSELYLSQNYSDEQSIDERDYYHNKVKFKNKNGEFVSLTYPRLLIVALEHEETNSSGQTSTITTTYTYTVPAGVSEYVIGDTERIRQEDMGVVRNIVYESFSVTL